MSFTCELRLVVRLPWLSTSIVLLFVHVKALPGHARPRIQRLWKCSSEHSRGSKLPYTCNRGRVGKSACFARSNSIVPSSCSFLFNPQGDTVTYTCHHGYTLLGSETITCMARDGFTEFVPEPPICSPIKQGSAMSPLARKGWAPWVSALVIGSLCLPLF